MISMENIKQKLSTNDIDVIRLCQKFVDERADLERMRGESAERRANIILSTLGASSAFLVFMATNLLGEPDKVGWLVIIMYAASALWISRSVWYCIKSIRTQSRYRVTAESVFEVQSKSEIEAVKDLLSGKIWELQRSIQPNTERLFYVQRAQRALIVFVGILLFMGVVVVTRDYFLIQPNSCVLSIISMFGVIFWLFGDYFIENSGIWNHGS